MLEEVNLLQLDGTDIDGDVVSCTGQQLTLILQCLAIPLSNCYWFVADIEVNETSNTNLPVSIPNPVKIGGISQLIEKVKEVDQFLSGVFLALPANLTSLNWPSEIFTEDEPYRDIGSVVVEIRTFDTTYFEIYSKYSHLLQMLAKCFDLSEQIPNVRANRN